jgi:hypothetical protein
MSIGLFRSSEKVSSLLTFMFGKAKISNLIESSKISASFASARASSFIF